MNKRIYYHLLFWAVVYLLWVFAFRSYSFSVTKTMTVQFCYLIFITADYYIINYLFVPVFFIKRKYTLFVVTTILIIAFSAGLRAVVAMEMNIHFFHAGLQPFDTAYFNSILNIAIWLFTFMLGKLLLDRIQGQRQLELLQKEKVNNELAFLKAQINPHALFNSLNTIYGHIDKSNQLARNTLLQFSELLRYQLYDCTSEKVMLGKEIDYIKNYVAFQQLRKDEHLIVELDTENIDENLIIAPLLLAVLIENAFKFVSNSSEKENKICIKLFTKGPVLNSYVFNTTEPQQELSKNDNSSGIGMNNLKRRLELLYHGKHGLKTAAADGFYEAILTIYLS